MSYEYTYRRRVEFYETDAAGVMHFSNYFRLMESAEHAFFRSLGLNPFALGNLGTGVDPQDRVGWPRVRASADYRLPLYYPEEVEVHLLVTSVRSKAIQLDFTIWKSPDDAEQRAVAATGHFTMVCVTQDEDGVLKSARIPEEWRAKITQAPKETA